MRDNNIDSFNPNNSATKSSIDTNNKNPHSEVSFRSILLMTSSITVISAIVLFVVLPA
jgi:hypothetical protein